MSSATLAKGTLFKMGDGASPEVFTTITELTSISSGPAGVTEVVDVTNHDTSGAIREKIPGLIEPVQITLRGNSVADTQQNAVRTAQEQRTLKNFKLVTTHLTPKTGAFAGYVIGHKIIPDPINGPNVVEIVIQQTGAVTWT
jgi:predicted secreted protein